MPIPQNIPVLEFQTLQFTCLLDSDLNSSNVINKNGRNQPAWLKFSARYLTRSWTLVSRQGAFSAYIGIEIRNQDSNVSV